MFLAKNSIKDFGKQFKYHDKIDDYWGSLEMLKDIVNPFDLKEIKNKIICEVGSGSGRILKNLLEMSPKKIHAVEPSESIEVAKKNKLSNINKIKLLNIRGQDIKFNNEIDFVFSLGVIHHIPDADKVCEKIYRRIGGK